MRGGPSPSTPLFVVFAFSTGKPFKEEDDDDLLRRIEPIERESPCRIMRALYCRDFNLLLGCLSNNDEETTFVFAAVKLMHIQESMYKGPKKLKLFRLD